MPASSSPPWRSAIELRSTSRVATPSPERSRRCSTPVPRGAPAAATGRGPSLSLRGVGGRASGMGRFSRFSLEGPTARGTISSITCKAAATARRRRRRRRRRRTTTTVGCDKTPAETPRTSAYTSPSEGTAAARLPWPPSPLKRASPAQQPSAHPTVRRRRRRARRARRARRHPSYQSKSLATERRRGLGLPPPPPQPAPTPPQPVKPHAPSPSPSARRGADFSSSSVDSSPPPPPPSEQFPPPPPPLEMLPSDASAAVRLQRWGSSSPGRCVSPSESGASSFSPSEAADTPGLPTPLSHHRPPQPRATARPPPGPPPGPPSSPGPPPPGRTPGPPRGDARSVQCSSHGGGGAAAAVGRAAAAMDVASTPLGRIGRPHVA